ncbi:hypothetical protein J6590_038686 [Homalodisca vitripennis]|nr:hypothetical protein J6590_038686 [Homalodisca vitripennis]
MGHRVHGPSQNRFQRPLTIHMMVFDDTHVRGANLPVMLQKDAMECGEDDFSNKIWFWFTTRDSCMVRIDGM